MTSTATTEELIGRVRFVKTSDNWCPTPKSGKVRVQATRLLSSNYRVCAWGADDFGVERDDFSSLEAAYAFLDSIPEPVTIQWFFDNGFRVS